ncbi:14-3-3-like protein GF14-6 [Histomonas meleagridis]|uniref:14-3-3-like protein GF14-6 n=1 Tax=Histomonas meleagridis TaxID=135588 RepID=UPI00355A0037|nr:14-3-3-like protein GF14-6 [Histomonas meleagridis]KAH0799188.1 14-3-3-like protein GF14-6 [Histomonas meleagridis]
MQHYLAVYFDFSDAKTCLNRLASEESELSIDDQNIISRICKGEIDSLRRAWKSIYLSEQKERGKGRDDRSTLILEYRKQLESKITDFTTGVVEMVQNKLIPRTSDTTMRGMMFKMIGDYQRYLAEIQRGYERRESTNRAMAAYQEAEDLIVACCSPAAAPRLSLMLNMAIFKFEILSDPDEALAFVKKAYADGVAVIDNLHNEEYTDSILLLQMLHRTIVSWTKNR